MWYLLTVHLDLQKIFFLGGVGHPWHMEVPGPKIKPALWQ